MELLNLKKILKKRRLKETDMRKRAKGTPSWSKNTRGVFMMLQVGKLGETP